MEYRGTSRGRTRALLLACAALACLLATAFAPAAHAQDTKRLLIFTGTTGYRHADAIDQGTPVLKSKLEAAGYTVDVEDCDGNGGGANNCDNANKSARIFTDANLAQYDAVVFMNSSWKWDGGGRPGPLMNSAGEAALIKFVQNGGGVAAIHNATDFGGGVSPWDWWDGGPDSLVGTTMRGHAATSLANVATVQVEDHNHLATRDLPDTWGHGDEHYNYNRNVRGTHHVLETLDERTYSPGGNAMGQDHPITWCKLYDGDNIPDGTSTPKTYHDGRGWVTGMGHFGSSYTENNGDNNMVKSMVGGIRWVAGEGRKSDCSGTVWSSFTRTVIVPDANNPIGIDVAKDGKVYWSEIGNPIGYESQGYVKMYDPAKPAGNKATVATIPTRADHGNSEDGVLGMSLQPGFDLNDPDKRNLFVYYSPRNPDWPTSGDQQVVGYNQISRFTLNADGDSVVPGSERVILRVPKAKISGNPSGFPGGPRDSGPGHVGGAGLDFDSDGNLYLGVGDDVSPNAPGHNGYTPMDYRSKERWDARKTAQNSADLRGKIIRITPKQGDIPADTDPGVDATYTIPDGNLFPVGTPKTRPEIYAMGFRQPFTVHTDPANPGIIGMGEYCHDNSSNGAQRAPAGTCEWNLIQKAGNFGWPFCMGDNSPANTSYRWDYANNRTTGQQYNCSLSTFPTDIRYAPEGQTPVDPTHDGLDELTMPIQKATIWKKYDGSQGTADFGDLGAGGMQPITGPIYRYNAETAGTGAFPRYYDGSWFINNRGSNNGFWKEVKLREDNNQMLRVQDWLPYNSQSDSSAEDSSLVIGTQFGPDGSLYMARFSVGCCRSGTNASQQNQIVKISFNVQDQCLTDTEAPSVSHDVSGQEYPDRPDTYVNSATLRLTGNDIGCAGVKTLEYREQGETDWHAYTDPVQFNQAKKYTIEYRATDTKDNVSAVKTATFEVLEIHDETPPTADASLAGNQDQRDFYVGSATLSLTATDDATGAGVETIEYRVNGGEWTEYTDPVAFNSPGSYDVDYRATDKVENTSDPKTVSFRVLSGEGCTQARSDEFDGTALGAQWQRHTRNNGTPLSAITFSDGQLHMPTADFELDAAAAATSVGPVNFIGQDLNALGDNWNVETEFTVKYTGGWQNTGLIVWNGDNNFFRTSITHSLTAGNVYVEMSKDNPTSTEGSRQQAGGNITILPDASQPVTIRMRMARVDGADNVTAQYRVMAPASVAMDDWANFGNSGSFPLDLNPSSGPRRDAEGSRIGIITGSNFPGTTGAHQYNGTPGTVDINYFRVSPDPVTCETDAPATTATLDPAAPATGDTYDRAVKVNLSATDAGTNAAGVEKTEYRITTDGTAGEWKTLTNSDSDDPFVNTITVDNSGTHTIEFRSTDKAANEEETKSVSFKVQLPVCDRSDEFDGNEILSRWIRHTRNGGTPTTGPLAPTVSGGQLHLPTNDYEIDAADSRTSVGPINFLGQDLAALGDNWTVETQFTAQYYGGWQNIGLVVWNGDNNFFRSTLTHNLSSHAIFVESSKDAPSSAEGTRTGGSSRVILQSNAEPVTIKMRYRRIDGANSVSAQYQILAPASVATADWVDFPNITGGLDLNPGSGPRRDAEGSRIGLIAQDNWPGAQGAADQPAIAHVDYFRVTPDDCPTGSDTTAPTTTATTAPAEPNGTNGWFTSDVNVTLAGDDGANGSGVDKIEYKVDDGEFAAYSAPIAITEPGSHTVAFRSTDKAGNVETAKSLTVKVDKVAPSTVAALDPAEPGPGGTYNGPVTLSLQGTDATSGVARTEYQVNGESPFGALGPAKVQAAAADWVTYDPDNKPQFTGAGSYTVDYRSVDEAGNVETAKSVSFTIAGAGDDQSAPVTTATLDPSSPGAGHTYDGPVTVKLSATDPAPQGPAPANVDIDAFGDRWSPDTATLSNGDQITWHFGDQANFPHDVWVVKPGGNQNPNGGDLVEVTDGIVFPGGPPVSKTFTENGTWTFLCKVHSQYNQETGVWSGMVGTATVSPASGGDAPSGVDYTEYRVKTGDDQGDWVKAANTGGADPFASEVTVSAEGQHTVEYRSVDKAGNVEDAQSVSFGIDNPEPGNPVIEAFADPETGTAPLEVRFSATGFDPDGGELTYKWEFEDGVYYGRARTRTYTKPGEYTAKVTATDDEGDTTSKEVTVTVKRAGAEPPTLEAGSDVTSVEAGGAVHFTATGTDPDGPEDDLLYTWDFGDGGSSFEQNPSHTYAEPGTYTAKVTVSDGAGASAEKTIEITVTDPAGNQAPTVEAGADRNTGTAPLNVTFTAQATDADGDTLTYEWDFADGSAKANGREVDHTYTDAGTYDAKVTVSDGNGGSTTATVRVVVGDPPGNQAPSVEATADPKSGTSPLTVHFSGQARDPEGEGLIATWDFGDGGRAAGLSATHVYTAAGTYTATLTVRDPKGGQATASVQVTVSAAQAAPRTPAPSAVAPAAVVPAEAAPEQPAWFGVAEPESTTIGKFAKRGLRVKVTCTEAMRGNVKLKVSRKLARKLGLKHRTLAKRSLKCAGAGSKSLKLKASKKVRRALKHSKRSVRITLQVRLRASGEATKQSKSRITLKRHS